MLEVATVRYLVRAIRTDYWTPGTDYVRIVVDRVDRLLREGDVLVLSEKAISTAEGMIRDESLVPPSFLAKVLAAFWMRKIWGYILGPLCRLNRTNLNRMRHYPIGMGARHKQLVLNIVGFAHALRNWSEGGIDVGNVPYAYASIPIDQREASRTARRLYHALASPKRKRFTVMIVDTDKTYTCGPVHITPRPHPIPGIRSFGLMAYVVGRVLKWRAQSTPIAVAGESVSVERALEVAAAANKGRGYGAGRTVWDMAEKYGVELNRVTWSMLRRVPHFPMVVVRTGRLK